MKKTLLSLAMTAALGAVMGTATAAPVALPYTIDTSSIPGIGGSAKVFQATQLSGTYAEQLTISAGGVVQSAAVATFSAFTTGANGELPINGSNGGPTGLNNNYSIYAIFTSTAQVINSTTFGAVSGMISLYMDPQFNTGYTVAPGVPNGAAPTASATSGFSDDYLLASSSTMLAYPTSFGNTNPPGSFEFVFTDFVLTVNDQVASASGNQSGRSLFSLPLDFYMNVRINGDIPNLNTTSPVQSVSGGKVSATFFRDVPEPGSLALMGAALAGLGFTQRKFKRTK